MKVEQRLKRNCLRTADIAKQQVLLALINFTQLNRNVTFEGKTKPEQKVL